MRIKSYFARTVEDAVDAARQELGPDAMLVNTQRAAPESRHLGDYEVVFALQTPSVETAGVAEEGSAAWPAGERISAEVAELKKELEHMRRAISRSGYNGAKPGELAPDQAGILAILASSEMPPDLARAVIEAAQLRLTALGMPLGRDAAAQRTSLEKAVVEEMEARFAVEPLLGRSQAPPRIVAMLGPAGAGKTTSLVKLAVNYGLACRRPALLVSMDTFRVGAAEQLRSYAAILGVGFHLADTVTALAQTIEEHRGKDLIFVDTPGLGFGEMDQCPGLDRFLATRGDIDTHLVLPASMKPADLERQIESFELFRPNRLLFTKLDETASFGPLFAAAASSSKPLSFFATGQRIPEDIEAASRTRLVELVLAGQAGRTLSAA